MKAHNINMGDLVIAKRKVTKHDSVYDPKPYKVVATYGTQIKGMRKNGKHKTRRTRTRRRSRCDPPSSTSQG